MHRQRVQLLLLPAATLGAPLGAAHATLLFAATAATHATTHAATCTAIRAASCCSPRGTQLEVGHDGIHSHAFLLRNASIWDVAYAA
jgi:hypothetical protein